MVYQNQETLLVEQNPTNQLAGGSAEGNDVKTRIVKKESSMRKNLF